jgi:hypothetical protein
VEWVKGNDPSSSVWKTEALPLSYTHVVRHAGLEPATYRVETYRSIQIELMAHGAVNRIRTGDPDLGKVVLYQLSYYRMERSPGFEPR